MQERVYNKRKIANVEKLRQRIVDEWEHLDQRIIDGAVKSGENVVKRYNAFCVKLIANIDTEQSNISKSTFPVRVSEHFHI